MVDKEPVGKCPKAKRSGRTECSASEKCRSWRTQPASLVASASLQTMVRDRNHNENPSFPDSLQRTKTHGNKIANTEWKEQEQEPLIENISSLWKSTSVRPKVSLRHSMSFLSNDHASCSRFWGQIAAWLGWFWIILVLPIIRNWLWMSSHLTTGHTV